VGLERGPLSLVSTTEELSREYGRRDPLRRTCGALYPQKLALTSPTSGDSSAGIVRSRIKVTELEWFYICAKLESLTLWEKLGRRVFEYRVLRVCGTKRDELTGGRGNA
jgi:hypothetical protein